MIIEHILNKPTKVKKKKIKVHSKWQIQCEARRGLHGVELLSVMWKGRGLLLLTPMMHNFLIRRARFLEGVVLIRILKISPDAFHIRGNVKVFEGHGSHANVLQFGQDVAVEVGEVVVAEVVAGGTLQEVVDVGEFFEESFRCVRHVLDEEGELGEDVQTHGVRLAVAVAEVGPGEVGVQVLFDFFCVHDHLVEE